MARLHLSLNAHAFDETVAYYRRLFDVDPAKLTRDYAKFDLDEPALNLALVRSAEPVASGVVNHLGVELGDPGAVKAMIARLEERDLVARCELDTVCCYARQDKVWTRDPAGTEWEFFAITEQNVGLPASAAGVGSGRGCC